MEQLPVTEDRVTAYYIYIGETESGRFQYVSIGPDLSKNDNRVLSNSDGELHEYGQKLFKRNNYPGAIFKVEEINNGKTVHYTSKDLPVDFWKNKQDCAKWKLKNDAVNTKKKIAKTAASDDVKEYLEPLRKVYREASHQMKAAILAEIISVITKP